MRSAISRAPAIVNICGHPLVSGVLSTPKMKAVAAPDKNDTP